MTERPIIIIIIFIFAITCVNLIKSHALSTSPIFQLIFLKRRSRHRFLHSRCLVRCFAIGNSRIRLSVLQVDAANRFAQSHQTSAGAVPQSRFSSMPFKSVLLLRTKIDCAVDKSSINAPGKNKKPEVAIHLVVSSQMIRNLSASYAAVISM